MENYTEIEKLVEHWMASRTGNVLIYRMDRKVLEHPRHPLPSIENPRVDGSIPPLATKQNKGLHGFTTSKPFCFV